MSDEPETTNRKPGKPAKATEMLLGKVKITDGNALSYCEWTVVGAGDEWSYSAIMVLKNGASHRIAMGTDEHGHFLYEACSATREDACSAVRARVLAFLRKQPRWRIIDTGGPSQT